MSVVGQILYLVLWLFIALLFVRFIVDWIQFFARSWTPRGPVLVVLEGVFTVTDPPIRFFRRYIPPIRLGGLALDLSFLLTFVVAYLLLILVQGLIV